MGVFHSFKVTSFSSCWAINFSCASRYSSSLSYSLKSNFNHSCIISSNSSCLVLPYLVVNNSISPFTVCFPTESNFPTTCSPMYNDNPSISLLNFNDSIISLYFECSGKSLLFSIQTSNDFMNGLSCIPLLHAGTFASFINLFVVPFWIALITVVTSFCIFIILLLHIIIQHYYYTLL